MITGSNEVRWFFDQPIRKLDLVPWELQSRTDRYAPLSHARSSVKFRDEATPQLDAKFLLGEQASDGLSKTAFPIQRWSKVTSNFQDQDVDRFRKLVAANWIKVAKERRMMTNREGVQVEWTRIQTGQWAAWSFCIEAPDSLGQRAVRSFISQLASELDIAMTDWPTAQSYPHWLAQLP